MRTITTVLVVLVALAVILILSRATPVPAGDPSTTLAPAEGTAPALTANKLLILKKLRRRDFAGLDAEFETYQQAAEQTPVAELNEKLAFDSFATEDPSVGNLLAEWVKKAPRSFAAHTALGSYFSWRGWHSRGALAAFDSAPASPSGGLHDYFDQSARELNLALGIEPKISPAYAILLSDARVQGDRRVQQKIEADALQQMPASFLIREEAMECRYPRWGGDHQMMEEFAQQSQAHARENPSLHWLLGFVDRDAGETLAIDGELDRSIRALTQAIVKGGDYSGFYFSRGESYLHRELYGKALKDFDRADQLSPQDPELRVRRAAALARLGRPRDALAELQFVAIFEPHNRFASELHDWAVAATKQPD